MTDITPAIPADRQVIDAYGGGGFRVGGTAYEGSIIVFPDRVLAWPPSAFGEITIQSFEPVAAATPPVEILLLGCGASAHLLAPAMRAGLRQTGVVVEAMDTGAACRTYNVLLAEERRVAAALIALA